MEGVDVTNLMRQTSAAVLKTMLIEAQTRAGGTDVESIERSLLFYRGVLAQALVTQPTDERRATMLRELRECKSTLAEAATFRSTSFSTRPAELTEMMPNYHMDERLKELNALLSGGGRRPTCCGADNDLDYIIFMVSPASLAMKLDNAIKRRDEVRARLVELAISYVLSALELRISRDSLTDEHRGRLEDVACNLEEIRGAATAAGFKAGEWSPLSPDPATRAELVEALKTSRDTLMNRGETEQVVELNIELIALTGYDHESRAAVSESQRRAREIIGAPPPPAYGYNPTLREPAAAPAAPGRGGAPAAALGDARRGGTTPAAAVGGDGAEPADRMGL
jgi:hypothetical protein